MQNLLAQFAQGLRRLELEEEQEKSHVQAESLQHQEAYKQRARRVTLRLAMAANRATWASCCEMSLFIRTGAHARKTYFPRDIYLSRLAFLCHACKQLLHAEDEFLLEASDLVQSGTTDMSTMSFTTAAPGRAPPCSVATPAESETHASEGEDTDGDDHIPASEERLRERGHRRRRSDMSLSAAAPELAPPCSVAKPAETETHADEGEDTDGDDDIPASEERLRERGQRWRRSNIPLSDAAADVEGDQDAVISHMKTLRSTTSTHDDWLHRGPYLHDLPFHTYAEYVDRVRLPRQPPPEGQVFCFEPHYVLSRSYCQRIRTPARIPVLEALRFVPPGESTREENALYKHIVGSLLRCTCADRCADPLLFKPFLERSGSAVKPGRWCWKLAWKARRAELEVLANRGEAKKSSRQTRALHS